MKDRSFFPRLPKFVFMFASAACLLSAPAFVSHASAQAPVLSFKLYKRGTETPIKSAAAGSTVIMVATISVPGAAAGVPIAVDAVATLKFVGVSVPYKIPMANLTLPNTNPQDGGTLLQSGTQQGELRIPSATPKGTSIKIKATATVAGATSNQVVAKLSVL